LDIRTIEVEDSVSKMMHEDKKDILFSQIREKVVPTGHWKDH
jgi:hypothetical protein